MKEHYLNSVRALLDCPSKERERLLSRLGSAVAAYLEDVPEAGEADIIANFGTPEDCAAKLLAECAPTMVALERQKKRHRHRIITAVLTALLVTVLGFAGFLCYNGWILVFKLS